MKLDPPFRNGVDPEVQETSLDRPLTSIGFLFASQPKSAITADQVEAMQYRPVATARDNYGLKGIRAKSHLPLEPELERGQ